MRDKLIKILRVPIFPHELADPTEAVADYLLDNDVVPVVRCRDCTYWKKATANRKGFLICPASGMETMADDFCSCGERREGE